MKDYRLAVLEQLDRDSQRGSGHARASARKAAEELRHELALEGIDCPDAPREPLP